MSSLLIILSQRERIPKVPQANEINRIIELVEKVGEGAHDAKTIGKRMSFDPRQSSYYREAAEMLGFLNQRKHYSLTELGKQLMVADPTARTRILFLSLLRFPVTGIIVESLEAGLQEWITKDEIEVYMAKVSKLNPDTVKRRTQTILAWLKWLAKNGGIIEVSNDVVRLSSQYRLTNFD